MNKVSFHNVIYCSQTDLKELFKLIIFLYRKLLENPFVNPKNTSTYTTNIIPRSQRHNFKESINILDWNTILSSNYIIFCCHYFSPKIWSTIDNFSISTRQKKRKIHLPWINPADIQLMKNRDYLLNLARKSGLSIDKQKFT